MSSSEVFPHYCVNVCIGKCIERCAAQWRCIEAVWVMAWESRWVLCSLYIVQYMRTRLVPEINSSRGELHVVVYRRRTFRNSPCYSKSTSYEDQEFHWFVSQIIRYINIIKHGDNDSHRTCFLPKVELQTHSMIVWA